MRTFKEVIRHSDEIQNLKNVAYCTLGVVVLVLGTFVGTFTASCFSGTSSISDIEQESTVELSLSD